MPPIPLSRSIKLCDWVEAYGGLVDPNLSEQPLTHVGDVSEACSESTLVLCAASRFVAAAQSSRGVVLCGPAEHARLTKKRRWQHPHALWVFAGLLEAARPVRNESPSIAHDVVVERGAVIHPGALLAAGVRIGANAVIYGGVELEEGVIVGAGAVIGRPGFGFASGPDGKRRRIPQLGGVRIGHDAEVGALSTVDAGTLRPTEIGAGTKLDAHVHVGHNVRLGRGCIVAAQVGFAGSVEVGDDVWIGGQAGVADHVRIGSRARIAAKSGVITDVAEGAVVAGFPNRPRMQWLRQQAYLSRNSAGGRRA